MKIFKLLRGIIARFKAVHTRRRSTIRDAPTLRSLPNAAALSPQAIETAIPTETAVVMEPALSIDTERLEEGGPGEFDVFGSIPSHSVGEADGLEEVVSTRELLTRQSAPSPDAGAQITHRTGTGEHPRHVATAVTRRRSVVHGQHSRKPYTPKFDVSQPPDVSDVEVEEFLQCAALGTLDAVANLPAPRLDALLMRALNRVRLIGELPINGAAFRQIAEIMRTTYIVRGRLNVRGIPPAIFVTSMVFCARYAEEEARNFWTPYAWLVWGFPEASLTFQNRCRKHFEACRNCLKEWYGFSFPIVAGQDGSVVRPVYHHAVIPYYLEDAFAIWLVQTLEHVQQLASDFGPEVLPTLLADEPSLNRVPPSLRSFILGETTSTTAAGLILQLCEAAAAYLSGEENVAHLISSPIERALWHKVQRELDGRIESERMRRGSQPVLTWGWLLEDEELQLRLAHVSSSDGVPNLIVWTEKGETALSDSDHCEFLEGYLWRRRDGWSLDEIRLSGGPVDGQIAVLSEDHEDDRPDVLFQSDVPLLPSGVILFARESRQEWATFVGRDRVSDGDWLISMAQGVALYDADGKPIASYQEEYVPDLLREHSAHITAGRYLLQLPVTVTQGGEPLYTIERLTEQIGTPVLEGPCQLPDLSSRVPPVFAGLPITLRIPGMTNELLSRTMLSVRSATFHKPYGLEELRTGSAMSMSVEGDFTIALDTLFPDEAGVYTLNLRRGLKSLLDEPLQFGYLPGLEVEAPEPKRHYTPANLPSARIFGVTAEQVVVDGTRAKRELIAGAVQVTWHDLRAPECSLRLDINDQSIALAWPINRTYAWVDNLSEAGRLRRKDRNAATIHVRGMRHQRAKWRVGGDSERELLLDAKGARDIELGRDQLIDIIEVRRETHVPVEICSEGETWLLFEYVRKPDLAVQHVTYDADEKQLILECRVGPVCEGEFLVQVMRSGAPTEEPEFTARFEILEQRLIINCIDCELAPGRYEVQVLSSDDLVDLAPGVANFEVIGKAVPASPSAAAVDVLSLLSLPGIALADVDLSDLDARLACILRELAEINRPDEWIARYGLLPAWAVTSKPLKLRTREHYLELTAYPELASHKGRAGKGSVDLKLDDGSSARVYAIWELMPDAENSLYSSQLKVMIPAFEVNTPFCELDEYDLWPAYQCSICGKLVGSRSGTYFKLSPSAQVVHRHGRKFPPKKHPFRDIVYDYDLHVAAQLASSDNLTYTSPPSDATSPSLQGIEHELTPISPRTYQRALEECFQDDRQPNLNKLMHMLEWELGFHDLHRARVDKRGRGMFAAAYRLIDTLPAARSWPEPVSGIEKDFVLLALLLRSRAVYPSVYDAVRTKLSLSEQELALTLSLALDTCPLLLQWAFTWVELFRVHAIS